MTDQNLAAPPLAPTAFQLDPGITWFMHCAEGPVPQSADDAVRGVMDRELRPWELRWEEDFQGIPRRTRDLAAQLCAADAHDITLTPTTSSALSCIAQSFPWNPGDEVVVPLAEFPSNYWPWQALASRGVRLRQVSLWEGQLGGNSAWRGLPPSASVDPESRLLDALSPSTRILAVSWVRFQDGLRLDLRRLAVGCLQRDVHLVVDGIQGAGVLPIDLAGLSAFATGGHKGLLAPQGQGFLWTSAAFREVLAPAGSWLSVEDAMDFSRPSTDFQRDWMRDGSRFEQGVPNLLGCAALNVSLQLLSETGIRNIRDHVRALQRQFLEGLWQLPDWRHEARRLGKLVNAGRVGPTLALHHGRSEETEGRRFLEGLLEEAKEAGLYLSVREGYLRVALHGWHRLADVRCLLEFLTVARSPSA